MPLEGSLKDFSLADIFQLIGLQKKTGILVLKNDIDEIKILFEKGMVVGADSSRKRLEDKLGRLLVKSGKISENQLQQVLEIQRDTLQQIGYVLIEQDMITLEELKEALQKQILQIVYRLFRWRQGTYEFYTKNMVDYNKDFIDPTPAEKILMEGMRMVDEWPLIEQAIPSYNIVYKKAVEQESSVDRLAKQYDLDNVDILDEIVDARPDERLKDLNHRQAQIFDIIDGSKDITDIVEASPMTEFDTCKTIVELERMYLIEKTEAKNIKERGLAEDQYLTKPRSLLSRLPINRLLPLLIFLTVTVVIAFYFLSMEHRHRFYAFHENTQKIKAMSANVRKTRIQQALRLFYLMNRKYPEFLGELIDKNVLDKSILTSDDDRDFSYKRDGLLYRLTHSQQKDRQALQNGS